ANPGKLPEQLQSNLAAINSANTNALALTNSISQAQRDKLSLENQVQILRQQMEDRKQENKVVVAAATQATKSAKQLTLENTLDAKKAALAKLRIEFTETYSGVRNMKTEVEEAQKQLDDFLAEEAKKPVETAAAPVVNIGAQREISVI